MGAFFGLAWSFISGGFGKLFAGIGAALAWLVKNPAILFALVFSVAFLFTVWSKNDQIAALAKDNGTKDRTIVQLQMALRQSNANVAALNISLDAQNKSILALKNQGDAASLKFDQLIAGQAAGNATISKKIAAIDAAKPGADKCASAFALVRSSVQ